MATFNTADLAVVEAMNRVLSTRMRVIGRAEEGTSGGAIFVELGDGAPGAVTTFLGTRERAEQTARFVNYAHASGLAVPPHLHVVEMGTSVWTCPMFSSTRRARLSAPLTGTSASSVATDTRLWSRHASSRNGHFTPRRRSRCRSLQQPISTTSWSTAWQRRTSAATGHRVCCTSCTGCFSTDDPNTLTGTWPLRRNDSCSRPVHRNRSVLPPPVRDHTSVGEQEPLSEN
jgi:hypothetical protein